AFDTPLGRLTATTSYTDWSLNPYDNRLVLPPTIDSKIVQDQRAWDEEVRPASDPHAVLAWHAGAWWSDGKTTGQVNRGIVTGAPVNIPYDASSYILNVHTAAVFGEIVFAPAAGWRVTVGARAEEMKKNFDRSQTVAPPGRFTAAKTFDAFTPKLT